MGKQFFNKQPKYITYDPLNRPSSTQAPSVQPVPQPVPQTGVQSDPLPSQQSVDEPAVQSAQQPDVNRPDRPYGPPGNYPMDAPSAPRVAYSQRNSAGSGAEHAEDLPDDYFVNRQFAHGEKPAADDEDSTDSTVIHRIILAVVIGFIFFVLVGTYVMDDFSVLDEHEPAETGYQSELYLDDVTEDVSTEESETPEDDSDWISDEGSDVDVSDWTYGEELLQD